MTHRIPTDASAKDCKCSHHVVVLFYQELWELRPLQHEGEELVAFARCSSKAYHHLPSVSLSINAQQFFQTSVRTSVEHAEHNYYSYSVHWPLVFGGRCRPNLFSLFARSLIVMVLIDLRTFLEWHLFVGHNCMFFSVALLLLFQVLSDEFLLVQ
jgi:hypothetical protein